MNSELERIRLLENRMRKKTKPSSDSKNEESIKSIKSTDSKKLHLLSKELNSGIKQEAHKNQSEQNSSQSPKLLSEEEAKRNKKITDYFTFKPLCGKIPTNAEDPQFTESMQAEILKLENEVTEKQNEKIDYEHEESQEHTKGKTLSLFDQSVPREQSNILKQNLKKVQKNLESCKVQMLDYVIKYHKLKRAQLRHKISNNKIRLGEFIPDRRGKQIWIDGSQIREIKEKIEALNKEKEEIEKLKKQSKRLKQFQEDPDEWKNSISSQSYFLTREENHCQEMLKRLEEQKALHIKEFKLLFDEEHSRYGRVDSSTGVPNWVKIKKYQLLSLLGKGGFSEVYLAYDVEETREVACKIHEFNMNWSNSSKENYIRHALRENNVHKGLSHPNIVKLYDTVEIDKSSFCTVLEYCEGPDLSYHLKKHKRVPEKEAKMIIKQVINAIRYLHTLPEKVIHYDLKPMNILFHKGKVKITDFGLCKVAKEDMIELTSQGVGTYWYLPPECFQTDKKAIITPKVDIWSIGVVYYEMLFGEKPFGEKMSQLRVLNEGIMLKATSVSFPVNQKNSVSNESKEFIKDCLKANVEERMDIIAASSHKLFEKK